MHLFGELFYEDYDEIDGARCYRYHNRTQYDNRTDKNLERCPDLSNIMKVLLFAYMFLGNVLQHGPEPQFKYSFNDVWSILGIFTRM